MVACMFSGRGMVACMISVIRDVRAGRGRLRSTKYRGGADLVLTRSHRRSSALRRLTLLLATDCGFTVSSVNYGTAPKTCTAGS